jgi:glycosyltransferase involved in cell wall biosynthesis
MKRPRLCFVGPHLGRHPGWVLSQGEILAQNFRDEGWLALETSSLLNPLLRAADMASTLWRKSREIDLVILSCYSGRAFRFTEMIGKLCEKFGLPLVAVLHGGALPEFFAAEPARAKKALGRARALVAPSPFLARAATELGLAAKIIPNVFAVEKYLDRERRELDSGAPRLLWMRTFHEIYQPVLALETLAILRRKGVAARLTMAGQDKGELETCRRRAAELGLAEIVEFPGFLDLPAKIAAFSRHDLFLNTNQIDNTPVTVLEAAAAGLPIVATAAGGLPHLLEDGKEALLAPIGDAGALAAAVERLLGDEELRRKIAGGGRQVAEKSSWTAVYALWQELFQEILPTTTTNSPLSEGRAPSSATSAESGPRKTSS